MTDCDLCHEEPATTQCGDLSLCSECLDGWDYYESLTPAERRADDAAQAAYVEESRDWP